eukprot:TRINITY_DN67860_c11_g3_i1.p1 TRINITY_DN67860_c11_g3~~TRINITY_DN67860_c11_g3_i1.p1  ORF type:complete len:129 (-),score=12.07 TRINITY_DN67860_c11_g3_i1:47-433(-)
MCRNMGSGRPVSPPPLPSLSQDSYQRVREQLTEEDGYNASWGMHYMLDWDDAVDEDGLVHVGSATGPDEEDYGDLLYDPKEDVLQYWCSCHWEFPPGVAGLRAGVPRVTPTNTAALDKLFGPIIKGNS